MGEGVWGMSCEEERAEGERRVVMGDGLRADEEVG